MGGGPRSSRSLKALLNAHLSHRLAEALRSKGMDVEAIVERDDLRDDMPDSAVLDVAAAEGRAVVTNNIKDFRPIAARRIQRGEGHPGLILIPSSVPRTLGATAQLARMLERLMLENPDGLRNSERWLPERD